MGAGRDVANNTEECTLERAQRTTAENKVAERIDRKKLESVSKLLDSLPAIEPEQKALTKLAVVKELRPKIESAMKRGYSVEKIAKSLTESGIRISAATLKNYLQTARSESGVTKKSRPRNAKAKAAESSNEQAPKVEAESQTEEPRRNAGNQGEVLQEAKKYRSTASDFNVPNDDDV